jgi:hypothetical protein
MKKSDLVKNVEKIFPWGFGTDYNARRKKVANVVSTIEKLEARISGKRGAEDTRDRFYDGLLRLYVRQPIKGHTDHDTRLRAWKARSAKDLAAMAGASFDEHGYRSGDYRHTYGLDFVGRHESAAAPYHDSGGAGLGLIEVSRTRTYAKSSKWRPSSVSSRFLVGKNEAGTYFTHPVSPNCTTVEQAVQWIWNGKANNIIQRQGDIALIGGNGGPKMPQYLPGGHKVQGDKIVHDTHPAIPTPVNPGERIIVGRRAAERAITATRD